jgi:WD40 repeat protein
MSISLKTITATGLSHLLLSLSLSLSLSPLTNHTHTHTHSLSLSLHSLNTHTHSLSHLSLLFCGSSFSCRIELSCRYELPSRARQVLEEHTDEVWFVKFSASGKYFASASKDTTCIIWKVTETNVITSFQISLFFSFVCSSQWSSQEATVYRTITGHGKPIAYVAWSPDDTLILTCGEKSVGLWDVTVRSFTSSLSHCEWCTFLSLLWWIFTHLFTDTDWRM